MTELERVRDVEARLELAEEFHEAAERHIPALLQGLEERGVAFDENGSIGFISHAIALVKRLETGEKVKPLDDDVLSQLEEEAIDISRQVLRPIEEAYGVALDDSERRFPPKAVELSYLVFCNETHRFGGVQREQIQALLSEIVRTVYDNPFLERESGETLQICFQQESVEFKIRLWGSFQRPLQPAVYLQAVPVLIESGRKRRVSSVRERSYEMERK